MIRALAFFNLFVRRVVFTLVFLRYTFSVIDCVEHVQQQSSTETSLNNTLQQSTENATEKIDVSECEGSFCLRKCCPLGQAYLKRQRPYICKPVPYANFVESAKKIELLNGSQRGKLFQADGSSYDEPRVVHGQPCESTFYTQQHERFYLSANGSRLFVELNPNEWNEYQNGLYCLELFEDIREILVAICYSPYDVSKLSVVTRTVYPIAMMVSIPPLLFTFLTYAMLKELRNLHGMKLMSHVAALLIGYLFFVLIQVSSFSKTWPEFCFFAGVVTQFSFLASFFWLNVMCFDVWWTFSAYRPPTGSPKQRNRKKFILYSVYSWGCPIIITSITFLAEFWHTMPDVFVRPKFSAKNCWFNGNRAILYYFYGPIFLVLLLNLMMFLHTTFNIKRSRKDFKIIERTGSRRHSSGSEKRRFFTYLNLFIVMGVNWSAEIISWLVGGPKYLWYFTDIGNSLQGVLIFVIFVCNRRVLHLLNQKLCRSNHIFDRNLTSRYSRSTSVTSEGSTRPNSRNSTKLRAF